MDVWDSHVIRPSTNDRVPHGRPNVMYMVPVLYDTEDYLCAVDSDELEVCKSECTFRKSFACDEDVFEVCSEIMRERNLQIPKDAHQGYKLYLELRRCLLQLL